MPYRDKRLARLLAIGTVIVLAGCRGPRHGMTLPAGANPLSDSAWADFILLDQPQAGLGIGQAYALTGAPQSGCYSVDTSHTPPPSYGSILTEWHEGAKAGVAATLADFLGFKATYRKSLHGVIRFDSVVVLRGRDLYPLTSCRDRDSDRLPTNPAIIALIGAHSFEYTIADSSKKDLSLEFERELDKGSLTVAAGGGAKSAHTRQRKFQGLTWFGVQLQGFTRSNPGDSSITATATLGEPLQLETRQEVTVTPAGSEGDYDIRVKDMLPGGKTDTIRAVRHNGWFALDFTPSQARSGHFTYGTLYIGGQDEGAYKLKVEPMRITSWYSTDSTSFRRWQREQRGWQQ